MDETGAEVLKRWRKAADISIATLTTDVGVTEGAGRQWEKGMTVPRRAVAIRVDRRLGAGGELAEAWGYAVEVDPRADEVDELKKRVDELESQRTELALRVQELTETTNQRHQQLEGRLAAIEGERRAQ